MIRSQFHQRFTRTFYSGKSKKGKKIQPSCQVFIALLGSALIKATWKMLVKSTPDRWRSRRHKNRSLKKRVALEREDIRKKKTIPTTCFVTHFGSVFVNVLPSEELNSRRKTNLLRNFEFSQLSCFIAVKRGEELVLVLSQRNLKMDCFPGVNFTNIYHHFCHTKVS